MSGGLLVEEREEEDEGNTLPPGRVMLMERLCNLVQRLSSVRVGGGMEADVIEVLNAKVDEMEDLLVLAEESAEAEATAEVEAHAEVEEQTDAEAEAEAEPASESEGQQAEPNREGEEAGTEGRAEAQEEGLRSGSEESRNWASGRSSAMLPVPLLQVDDQDIRDLASPMPWLTSTFKFSELLISPTHSHPELAAATNEALEAAKQAAQAQAEMAERVAMEAEKVNLELAAVVKRLQARKEESDVSLTLPTHISNKS
jgi:flagellar biosynthesis/type III secretory pathway protein FliH